MRIRHVFTATGGAQRTLPVLDAAGNIASGVAELDAKSIAPGGCGPASGVVTADEFVAFPNIYRPGTTWQMFDDDDPITPGGNDGRCFWRGEIDEEPAAVGGSAELVGRGDGEPLDDNVRDRFYQAYLEDIAQPSDSEPHDYDNDDKIEIEVDGRDLVFGWRRKEMFKRGQDGNPTSWSSGIAAWLEGRSDKITRVAGTIEKSRSTSADLQLLRATGPAGAKTLQQTIGLGAGGPATFDEAVAGAPDLLEFRLRRTTEKKKARGFKLVIADGRLNGVAPGDDFKAHQVVLDIAADYGGDLSGIDTDTTVNMLPLDGDGISDGDLLDEAALASNRYWAREANEDGTKLWKFKRWNAKEWRVTEELSPVTPAKLPRWNKVKVPCRRKRGRTGYVTKTATVDPFPGENRTLTLEFDGGRLPDPATAEIIAQVAADIVSEVRRAFTVECVSIEHLDGSGGAIPATRLRAGHMVKLPNHDDVRQPAVEVTYTNESVTAQCGVSTEGPTGHPVLDRILLRHKIMLARGASMKRATRVAFDVDRPATPTGATVQFRESQRKGGRRRINAALRCNEVVVDRDGTPTVTDAYVWQRRPVWKSTGVAVSEADGGGWSDVPRKKRKDQDDPDVTEDATLAIARNLERPRDWNWEFKVAAEDPWGRLSDFAKIGPFPVTAFDIPNVAGVSVDVDQHRTHVYLTYPDPSETDADGDGIFDNRFRGCKIKLFIDGVLQPDLSGDVGRRKHIALKIKKPGNSTIRVDAKGYDAYGHVSPNWVSGSGTRFMPPAPSIPSLDFFDGGKQLVTCRYTTTLSGTHNDDDIRRIHWEMQESDTADTSVDPRTASKRVEPATAFGTHRRRFKNVPEGRQVRCRAGAEDTRGHISWSAFSSWIVADDPSTPPVPQSLGIDSGPRAVIWSWTYIGEGTRKIDNEIAHFEIDIYRETGVGTGSYALHRSKKPKNTYWELKIAPGTDYGRRFYAVVRSVGKGDSVSGDVTSATLVPGQNVTNDMDRTGNLNVLATLYQQETLGLASFTFQDIGGLIGRTGQFRNGKLTFTGTEVQIVPPNNEFGAGVAPWAVFNAGGEFWLLGYDDVIWVANYANQVNTAKCSKIGLQLGQQAVGAGQNYAVAQAWSGCTKLFAVPTIVNLFGTGTVDNNVSAVTYTDLDQYGVGLHVTASAGATFLRCYRRIEAR